MFVTNNAQWAARAKYLTTQAKDDPIEYVHNAVGYNYRLTNLLAAVGCAQMEQLDAFVEMKRQIANKYKDSLGRVAGIRVPEEAVWAYSTFWMYTVLIDEKVARMNARELLSKLASAGIQTRPLWQPIHRSQAHGPYQGAPCPNADELYDKAISLPCSVGLTPSDQDRVIQTIANLLDSQSHSSAVR
jgi:dTDP-4-amino-4,6-dideoxygalactose transaminase